MVMTLLRNHPRWLPAVACHWSPSVDFVDAATGRPIRNSPAQWHPFDVKMVQVTDRWLVAGVARGDFTCEEARP